MNSITAKSHAADRLLASLASNDKYKRFAGLPLRYAGSKGLAMGMPSGSYRPV